MAVTDFDTKVAVVVRDDLAAWQRINVCAFLMSGVVAGAGEGVVGPDYEDASGRTYLPMLVQPVLVFEAPAGKLRTVYERAVTRELRFAIYTADLFIDRARRRQPRGGARGRERRPRPGRARRAGAAQGGRRRRARLEAASLTATLSGMEPEVLGAGDVTGARTSQPARRFA